MKVGKALEYSQVAAERATSESRACGPWHQWKRVGTKETVKVYQRCGFACRFSVGMALNRIGPGPAST